MGVQRASVPCRGHVAARRRVLAASRGGAARQESSLACSRRLPRVTPALWRPRRRCLLHLQTGGCRGACTWVVGRSDSCSGQTCLAGMPKRSSASMAGCYWLTACLPTSSVRQTLAVASGTHLRHLLVVPLRGAPPHLQVGHKQLDLLWVLPEVGEGACRARGEEDGKVGAGRQADDSHPFSRWRQRRQRRRRGPAPSGRRRCPAQACAGAASAG